MDSPEPNDARLFLPERPTLTGLRAAAASCHGCHLWRAATQTVFGEGLKRSRVMVVGEQPGDREDREGRPFVGPAGRELDRALVEVGIDRRDVYVTNVVKHFKFEERGRRRMHQTPKRFEIDACRPWLDEELRLISPEALLILGATAGKALLGSSFRIREQRGRALDTPLAPLVVASVHPSAILRARTDEDRHAERRAFTQDLATLADALADARE